MKRSDPRDSSRLPAHLQPEKAARTRLQEADWCFIQKGKYKCADAEKPILFRYELARELGLVGGAEYLFFKGIFDGYFPDTPYLKIRPEIRTDLWKQAFRADSGHIPLFDVGKLDQGFTYTFSYAIHDSTHAETWQEQASLDVGDFDYSLALIQLNLDFDYPDSILIQKFKELLRQVRKTKEVHEFRGKNSLDSALKQLAATRLLAHHGTPEKAQEYVISHEYELPYGGGTSGWYKAKNKMDQWRQGSSM